MGFFGDLFRRPAKGGQPAVVNFPAANSEASPWKHPAADAVLPGVRPRVTVKKIDVDSLRICDLRALPRILAPVVDSESWLADREYSRFGATEYLLVRESDDRDGPNVVGVYGKSRTVGP